MKELQEWWEAAARASVPHARALDLLDELSALLATMDYANPQGSFTVGAMFEQATAVMRATVVAHAAAGTTLVQSCNSPACDQCSDDIKREMDIACAVMDEPTDV